MEADRVERVWSIALWQYCTKMSEEESRAEKCEAFLHSVAAKMHFFQKMFAHVKKKQYLCTQISKLGKNGQTKNISYSSFAVC